MNQDYFKKELLKHFDDNTIEMLKKNNVILAGGALTSVACNREVADYDLYFKNKESLKDMILDFVDDSKFCTYATDKSMNFSMKSKIKAKDTNFIKVQFIYYDFYEEPEQIFNHYDFTVNMAAYDFATDTFVFHGDFWMHNAQRYIGFNENTKFPIVSGLRLQKYQEKGYTFTKNTFVKVMLAASQAKITTWKEFKAQVGTMYGIASCKVDEKTLGEFSIEKAYEVLDNHMDYQDTSGDEQARYHPVTLAYLVSGYLVKYCEFNGNKILIETQANEDIMVFGDSFIEKEIFKLVDEGLLESEKVSVKEYLGEYLYKWVSPEVEGKYRSATRKCFYYNDGEISDGGDKGVYCCTKDNVKRHYFKQTGRIIIKMAYDVNDVLAINGNEVMVRKVTTIGKVDSDTLELV